MKKTIRFVLVIALLASVTSACKSKQKVAEIPAGANIEASVPPTVVAPPPPPVAPSEPEVTRNENFTLSDGDQNAMKFKYHVVVGSFSKQTNAKGLQTTLNSEGNNAIIVVNEQGMFRVLIASFNEYYEARQRINQIKSRFADAWVLVQK